MSLLLLMLNTNINNSARYFLIVIFIGYNHFIGTRLITYFRANILSSVFFSLPQLEMLREKILHVLTIYIVY